MDAESSSWLTSLDEVGATRDTAMRRLHELLLRVAIHEVYLRGPAFRIGGPELDDVAHQAVNDAMVSLLAKVHTFRGESRFTTWAYRFVALEVANKLGRHVWRRPSVCLDAEEWDRLPTAAGVDPLAQAQQRELVMAVQRAIDETLSERQRHFFVEIVINDVPVDAMASRAGSNRGAIYKIVFDARRKIRAYLTANGYLEPGTKTGARGVVPYDAAASGIRKEENRVTRLPQDP